MHSLLLKYPRQLVGALFSSALLLASGPACINQSAVEDLAQVAQEEMLLAAEMPALSLNTSIGDGQTCVSDMGEECFSIVTSLRCGQDNGMQKFSAACDASFSDDGDPVSHRYHALPDHMSLIPCATESEDGILAVDFEHNVLEVSKEGDRFIVRRCDIFDVRGKDADTEVLYANDSCRTYEVPRSDICQIVGSGDPFGEGRVYQVNGIAGTEFCEVDGKAGCRNAPGYCVTDEGPYDISGRGDEGTINTSSSGRTNGWKASTDECRWRKP